MPRGLYVLLGLTLTATLLPPWETHMCMLHCWINSAVLSVSQSVTSIWCVSQARINWKGCVRKGILRKNVGDGRGWATN